MAGSQSLGLARHAKLEALVGVSVVAPEEIYIRDSDRRNSDDVRAYIRTKIAANRVRMEPRIKERSVSEPDFVVVLTPKSAGNFMYLVRRSGGIDKQSAMHRGNSLCSKGGR